MDQESMSPEQSPSAGTLVLSFAVAGMLFILLLLTSYYLFITKCCLHWRRRRDVAAPEVVRESAPTERGLGEAAVRWIPEFRYTKGGRVSGAEECAVCLSRFKEEERLRSLPGCLHAFHADCVGTWLLSNASCPLCRSVITAAAALASYQFDRFLRRENAHEDIVIEIGGDVTTTTAEVTTAAARPEECGITPMRRSFSMDSIAGPKILRQNATPARELGHSGRLLRSFFSFRQHRHSAVLPI